MESVQKRVTMARVPPQGSSRRNQLKGKEKSRSNIITIDTLPDELLVEILIRLGSSKDAFRCKAVSKHWNGILSHPLFKSRFVNYYRQKNQPLPIVFVKTFVWSRKPDVLQPPWLSLGFLIEGSHDPRLIGFVILGTFNDLLLVGCRYSSSNFYICNPQTKQWRAIPSSPSIFWKDKGVLSGFICNSSNCQDFSQEFRYRIVLISLTHSPEYQKVEIFFSETGNWRQVTLSFSDGTSPYFDRDMETSGIPLNGMLHWMSLNKGYIIRLNPFSSESNVIHCSVISLHDLNKYFAEFSIWQLGAFQGRLRLVSFTQSFTSCNPRYLRVFELENETSANGVDLWHCAYEFSLTCLNRMHRYPKLFAFHPANGAVMYLVLGNSSIFMCDMRRRTLDFICRDSLDNCNSFPIVLPWWPTWIPPLPQASFMNP